MDMQVTSTNDSLAANMTGKPTDSFVDSRDFARMTRAIEFIEREFERQPRLAEIARHVGLSEFHFNRLFRRWTGLTPKQYLAEVTARAASAALRDEPSVMEAAHAVGLSGGGRLHDLTVTLEAMTPGEIRAQGEGVVMRHGIAATPFGSAFLAETPRGLCRLAFVEPGEEREELAGLRQQFARAKFVRDDAPRGRAGENDLGRGRGHPAARRLRHQFPGPGLARPARTRARRHGHIQRAGKAPREVDRCARRGKRGGRQSGGLGNPLPSCPARGRQTRRISLGNGPQTDDSPLGNQALWGVITF